MERLPNLAKIFLALSNENRLKVYHWCLKKKYNLSELQEMLKISYKSTLQNVQILEENKLVKREKDRLIGKGVQSLISSTPLKQESIYYKFYLALLEEKKIK